jgi:hypothetical protein
VFLANGDGSLRAPSPLAVGRGFGGLVASDLDGDDKVDLATSNAYSGDISVLLGNGDGTFHAETRFAVETGPGGIVAVDLDGNGRTDVVTTNTGYSKRVHGPCSDDISVLLNALPPLDLGAPVLRCPAALTVPCTGPQGANVEFSVSAEDDCDARPLVACDFPSGAVFPPGTTVVTCTARDASGNQAQCAFEVAIACRAQLPGDCNQDRKLNILDPICLLHHLFLGSPSVLPCGDGTSTDLANIELLDWTGDSRLDLSDGVSSLLWLFLDGPSHILGVECRGLDGCPESCM